MKKRILVIFHDAASLSGASMSMLSSLQEMANHSRFDWFCMLPEHNEVIEDRLRESNITPVVFSYWTSVYRRGSVADTLRSFAKCCVKELLNTIAVHKLRRFIAENKITLVYTNTSVITVGARAASRSKVPHIWHIREFCEEDHHLHFLLGRKWFYRIASQSARIIVISRALAKKYQQHISEDKIRVVYNDIPLVSTEMQLHSIRYPLRILVTGSIQPGKRQMDVISAAKILKQRGIAFHISFAGKIQDQDYARKVRQLIADSRLSESVTFLGLVKDMDTIRAENDIAVVPSECEAFGRVTIEALLAGMLVIASDTGANPELIKDKSTGFLFRCGDSAGLADILTSLSETSDKSQLDTLIGRGYESALRFTGENSGKNINLIVSSVLDGE
ncbi:glycosyltransferase family 4 protein [Pseudoscardovia suis]|uniref:Glycosyl transferases group 1 n=1 Tax=Pseudoscardovia suis TaxID=987063 RepID=A0A261EW32_9BIFI|nr:glycosyltransferase family 4 protein [Pseudoscardovia suis]OZG51084.1 Glycosyl transferases group 1 [Pseudoscardovia suis]PJJ62450.1 glycosyltransferase involved in cell wall biosynthesis [Pseudoscardovia suis]